MIFNNDKDVINYCNRSGRKMQNIKVIITDIDGVITDGKMYVDALGNEMKSISFKDLDALGMFKEQGYILGCITGEDIIFDKFLKSMSSYLDFIKVGCKNKLSALYEAMEKYHVELHDICYIGDGKYDIPILQKVGCAVCPNDAINEVKDICNLILKRNAGEGCLAELYTYFNTIQKKHLLERKRAELYEDFHLKDRLEEHETVLKKIMCDSRYLHNIEKAINIILISYNKGGNLFLCGNGGSAADAQHLAAELVGRFYFERKGLYAEALTTNSSIITALANDYSYDYIFERQIESKSKKGDVLIGITTSGNSENIYRAFIKAKKIGVFTVLMTGNITETTNILKYTDCLLDVPSNNTPRIQEMHIIIGHIICENIERILFSKN